MSPGSSEASSEEHHEYLTAHERGGTSISGSGEEESMFGEEEEQCVCWYQISSAEEVARSQTNAPSKSGEEVCDGGNCQSTWWFDQAGGEHRRTMFWPFPHIIKAATAGGVLQLCICRVLIPWIHDKVNITEPDRRSSQDEWRTVWSCVKQLYELYDSKMEHFWPHWQVCLPVLNFDLLVQCKL